MNAESVQRWFDETMPADVPRRTVVAVRRISRGVSRETWLVEVGDDAGGPVSPAYVIRRDLDGGSIDASSLRQEYEIYRCLERSPVAVARAVLYDDDPDRCPGGRPAYVRECVDGSWRVPHFDDPDPRWDDVRLQACRDHVAALAAVHGCDWRALGLDRVLPAPASAAESAHAMIDQHVGHLRDAQFVPHPAVTAGIAWLRRTAPAAEEVCFLKGTNGLGEEIFRDGRLMAMSDWELAALGDPAYDWAQLQGFTRPIERDGRRLWDLEIALAWYRDLTGRTVTREAIRWYYTLYGLIMFTFAHRAARALAEGRDRLARLAWVATEIQHHGQARLAAAAGLSSGRNG